MTATPCLIGRSSSHFTRVPRMLALELGIECAFQPVYDLGSRHTTDYGGNPAMKLPVLRLGDGQVAFGAENVARTLAELAPSRIDLVWTEQLPVWPLLRSLASDRDMADHVHLVDDVDEAAAVIA